jgi:hypothetical protein
VLEIKHQAVSQGNINSRLKGKDPIRSPSSFVLRAFSFQRPCTRLLGISKGYANKSPQQAPFPYPIAQTDTLFDSDAIPRPSASVAEGPSPWGHPLARVSQRFHRKRNL